jgi:uncharacterized protein YcbK (DUF882 family)
MDELEVEHTTDVDPDLLQKLAELDSICGGRLLIHRLFSADNPKSQHAKGKAADLHIEGWSVVDMYIAAERLNPGGLGVYGPDVWTHTPGLHFDIRSSYPTAKWGCILDKGKRKYVALNRDFFKRLIELEEEQP